MTTYRILIGCVALLALAACGGRESGETRGAQAAQVSLKRTVFTDSTELFLEFPPLVVGREAAFAAHLTRLADFKPVDSGRVTVVLAGGGVPEERFAVEAPSAPGIFRPIANPQHAGARTLSLLLEGPNASAAHDLGAVTIFADEPSAAAAHAAQVKGDDGIAFLKEQQWKVDFATTAASRRTVGASVPATGVLRAHPDGEALINAPTAGVLAAAGAFPRIGAPVKRGDVLAWLTPRLGGDTDIATLDSAARKGRVALDLAHRERERLEALYAMEAVAEKRVIAARAEEQLARAELDAAERRLGQYQGKGGGIPIRAGASGVLAEVKVAPGAFVNEGQLLFHVAGTDRLWLEARVPESALGRIGTPLGAWFRPEGFERGFDLRLGDNARLVGFGGVVDGATRTVPLLIEFANPDRALRIGMGVSVQIRSGEARDAIVIPTSAVLDESGLAVVYVQKEGESFERRLIETGLRAGELVEARSGLAAGERVVSRGAYLVRLAALSPASAGEGHTH